MALKGSFDSSNLLADDSPLKKKKKRQKAWQEPSLDTASAAHRMSGHVAASGIFKQGIRQNDIEKGELRRRLHIAAPHLFPFMNL